MNSGDRLGVAMALIVAAFLAFTVFTLDGCSARDSTLQLQRDKMELSLKMKCIEQRGQWISADGDRRPPYTCKF